MVNFTFRSTIYRLEARSENAIGAQGGHAKFRSFLRRRSLYLLWQLEKELDHTGYS